MAEWIVRLELPILAILAPLLLFPNARRSLALLGIPLIWIARKTARGRFIRRTPLDWAIWLLMLMVLVSLYATFDIAVSLPRIAILLCGVAVFYAVVEAIQSDVMLRWASATYLIVGAGLVGLAAIGMQRLQKLPMVGNFVMRLPVLVRGLSENPEGLHPNIVAGALLWFIPLSMVIIVWLWRTQDTDRRGRWLSLLTWVGAMAAVGILVLSQSRAGMTGFAVSVLILLASTGRRGRIASAFVLVVSVIVLMTLGAGRLGEIFIGTGVSSAREPSLETLSGRVEVWSRALYAIQDFPFTGMGMGTFPHVIPVLYPYFTISPDAPISHAHDEFLQVAVDLGIPGLVAFLAIYLASAQSLIAVIRRSTDSFRRAAALGVAVGLASHAVHGLTDAVLLGTKPSVVWWMLLGLGMATFALERETVQRQHD
jgi:putative inorganic carbon (HCO3(-)) transporter